MNVIFHDYFLLFPVEFSSLGVIHKPARAHILATLTKLNKLK